MKWFLSLLDELPFCLLVFPYHSIWSFLLCSSSFSRFLWEGVCSADFYLKNTTPAMCINTICWRSRCSFFFFSGSRVFLVSLRTSCFSVFLISSTKPNDFLKRSSFSFPARSSNLGSHLSSFTFLTGTTSLNLETGLFEETSLGLNKIMGKGRYIIKHHLCRLDKRQTILLSCLFLLALLKLLVFLSSREVFKAESNLLVPIFNRILWSSSIGTSESSAPQTDEVWKKITPSHLF